MLAGVIVKLENGSRVGHMTGNDLTRYQARIDTDILMWGCDEAATMRKRENELGGPATDRRPSGESIDACWFDVAANPLDVVGDLGEQA